MKSFPLLFGALMVTTFLQAQLVTGDDIAVANTENGQVRGYIHNTIFTYKGIPYAEAKRFETPGKPQPWTGIRSSMTYGPVAPLVDPTTTVMDESEFVFHHDWGYTSEDCMRLNIWTPALDGKKRPVLFWMHGGGFTAGSSQELPSYDGESLAKSGNVVVVSINHRLNILGFLDLSAYGDPFKTSANNSMLDLVMALQWVRDNISNFGGDPGNVTIFGQSGGGAKVNTLMAMPMAKGLFHKAINQSGAIRSDMFEKPVTQAIGAAVLEELGIAPGEVAKIQEIPFDLLAAAGKKALKRVENQLKAEGKPISVFGLNWGPSVDDEVLPYQLFSDQAMDLSRDIPLLIGTVKN
nr:carboxylesterase family protein [Saprospiraceae bacterium]